MAISVIIPVYNAEKFVRRAVESALDQKETDEVILIEDGSTDSSLEECYKLRGEYDLVIVIRHESGLNKGAGASRNLGIKSAKNEWIGFLDADDFFLPERFSHIAEILDKNPDCEGVCDAVGVHFDDNVGKARWEDLKRESISTLNGVVRPDNMFEAQLGLSKEISGHCASDGFTVSKKALFRVEMFPEGLTLHQDTALWGKLGAAAQIYPGKMNEPVSMRGVHQGNRITAPRSEKEIAEARILMWLYLWKWGVGKISIERLDSTLNRAQMCTENLVDHELVRHERYFMLLNRLILLGLKEPRLFADRTYIKKLYSRTLLVFITFIKDTFSIGKE